MKKALYTNPMNDLNCPKCSTRFIQGETTCEFCGYKIVSKFSFYKRVNEPSSENNVIRKIELEEIDHQKVEKAKFREAERKLGWNSVIFLVVFTSVFVVVAIIASSK